MNTEIQRLIENLRAPDADTRVAAADALGQYGALHADASGLSAAVPSLLAALGDDSRDVRWSAAYALGAIGEAAGVPGLLALLADPGTEGGLRLVAIKALGKIGAADAAPALIAILRDGESRCLRVAAARSLVRIGTAEALTAVEAGRASRGEG
jgi:HEAT repeat protein